MVKKLLNLKLIGLIPIALAAMALSYKVKPPKWQTTVLDTKHPRRFVAVTMYQGMPFIVYFNEQGGGGLFYQRMRRKRIGFVDALSYYRGAGKREWETGVIDDHPKTGMFVSVTADSEKVHVAYQDGTLGDEKLIYAVYDGKTWVKEVVDDVSGSGINVGMYTSISVDQGEPVIFYHTEQGQKFGYARKSKGVWKKQLLETKVGWLTSSESCGGKTYVAYRGRDQQNIYLGELNHSVSGGNNETDSFNWFSKPLEASTSSGLALTTKKCKPYLLYFNNFSKKVELINLLQGSVSSLGEGKLSRVSLAANKDGFHAAYYFSKIREGGLVYGFSPDGETWELEQIATGRRDGWYNAITADEAGNVYLAFNNDNSLKVAEYNVSASRAVRKVKTITAGALSLVGLVLFVFL